MSYDIAALRRLFNPSSAIQPIKTSPESKKRILEDSTAGDPASKKNKISTATSDEDLANSIAQAQAIRSLGSLHKLPAVVRSQIYRLTLPENNVIRIQLGFERQETGLVNTRVGVSWPTLLVVSKELRREAGCTYYGTNNFEIAVHVSGLHLVAKWLLSVVEGCKAWPFKRLDVAVEDEWYGSFTLCQLLHLVSIIRTTTLDFSGQVAEAKYWTTVFHSECDSTSKMLEEIVVLVLKAKYTNAPHSQLMEEVNEYARGKPYIAQCDLRALWYLDEFFGTKAAYRPYPRRRRVEAETTTE